METKKKKKILNAVMVVMALLVVAGGVLGVGHIKGWFKAKTEPQGPSESVLTVDRISGVCKIERMGVGYELKTGDRLQPGDILETADLASLSLKADDGSVFMLKEKTELQVVSLNAGDMKYSLLKGSVLINAVQRMAMEIGGYGYEAESSVFSADVHTGSSSVKVFSGHADLYKPDGSSERIEAAQEMMVSETGSGTDFSVAAITPDSLDDETIKSLIACGWDGLCFAKAELEGVLEKREAEKRRQQEEAARKAEEEKQSASGGGSGSSGQGGSGSSQGSGSGTVPGGSGGGNSSGSEGGEEPGTGNEGGEEPGTGNEGGEEPGTGNEGGDEPGTGSEGGEEPGNQEQSKLHCTIQIVCYTILDNWDNLDPDKAPFVPGDGVILYNTTVEFDAGQTVFDVLCYVCDTYGIQLEYSWTPIYDSYYIEGINYLYEKDCGDMSGWMYKVNGWVPNYGCSSYVLSDGDAITWCYTCNGYGEDI
ncbi:MAG: DUF4430 domain-containing protein [Firmicutes bacterium]|nr:DUF4430 domain-containing protein [Bacillota bacterium]